MVYKSVSDILESTQFYKILIYPKGSKRKKRKHMSCLEIYNKTEYLKW